MGKRSAKTEEEDDSQNRKRQKLGETELKCGESGIIESVCLVNFMCHENLSFEFGPHINFIIGRNGSGKSAILTGIILALGGRSSVTGRYPNIKGFIKEGKQKARIEVVLRNRGDQPYKPDLYGSKVTVVREINADGVSSYKLKSASGKVISHQKEELNNILNAMDIQIENPVSLLTQENSRSFLTSKKPDKLYQFYYHGSGLEMLERSYNSVQIMYADAAAELQRKKEMLPGMEKDIRAWKKIIETSSKVQAYEQELLWANVKEMERQLQQKEEELKKAKKDQEVYKVEHDKCKNKLDESTSSVNELEKKFEKCEASMAQSRSLLRSLKEKENEHSGELRITEGKRSAAEGKAKSIRQDILTLQNSINENSKRYQTDQDEEKRLRDIEIHTLKRGYQKYHENLKVLQQEKQRQMESRNDLLTQVESVQSDIHGCSYGLKDYERVLAHSQIALKNRVNVFGDQTQNVLNEIKKYQKRFSQPPKGPIGMYVEVKDSKWSDAVEECVGPVLKAYCCDNLKDSQVLTEILRKFYPQNTPSVIISKYVTKVHDISQFRPQVKFPTVYEMLRISDPVIANILIDSVSMESRVLIEDTKSAVEAMIKNPKNCYGAILMDCSTISLNPYRFYSSGKRTRKPLLSSISKSKIESLKELVANSQASLVSLINKKDSLQAAANEITQKLAVLDKKIVATRIDIKRADEEIKDLESFQELKDTQSSEEDLEQLESEYKKVQIEVQKYNLSVAEQKKIISQVTNEIHKNTELLYKAKTEFDNICSDLNSSNQDKEAMASAVKRFAIEFKEATDKLKPLEKEVEKYHKHVQTAIRIAEEVGSRIDTDRSCEELQRLLEETKKIVEQQSNCNREELREKYEQKLKTYKQAKKKLAEKEQQVEHINQMYRQRKQHFKTICHYTEHIIKMAFNHYLNNYYSGKLVFDAKARTLSLEAMPNKTGSEQKKRGGKCSSLSGGERSYVTIAFLLALWDRIKSPFKILDEYDVFMDSNNRNLSIGLLTEQAENSITSQFIFLSPLDLPEIKHSPYIKVHQMQEPKRDENASL